MATTNVTLTTTWTLLVTGPTSAIGTVSALTNNAEFAIGASAPAATVFGFKSYQSDPLYFELSASEKLYGRASGQPGSTIVILNT